MQYVIHGITKRIPHYNFEVREKTNTQHLVYRVGVARATQLERWHRNLGTGSTAQVSEKGWGGGKEKKKKRKRGKARVKRMQGARGEKRPNVEITSTAEPSSRAKVKCPPILPAGAI